MNPKRFFAELKRRNVVRMAGLYLVGAWLLVQVAGTVLPMFEAPVWLPRSIVILLAIGFVPALVFSWVFERTTEGLRRDEDVRPEDSIAPQTAHRMNRMIIAVLVLALGYFAFDKFVLAPRRADGSPGLTNAEKPKLTEAERLTQQARALLDDDPLMTRANVELAEQLSLQAVAKDQTSAEAYAVAAWANFRFIELNYEDTAQRRADLRNYAERARLLAPDSVNAELAMTGVLLATDNRPEATARLRALADRAPGNLTVLRAYAGAAMWGAGVNLGDDRNSDPAALARLRAFSPLGRAYADSFLANQHWAKGEYVEAERLLNEIFASGHPVRLSYLLRLLVLTYGWGDLPAARDFVATLPAKLLLEDVFIFHVTNVWLWSGDSDKALATLDRTQREMLQEAKIQAPTALFRGEVLAAGGRPGAAAIQWRAALGFVDKLLAGNPGHAFLHLHKAQLLTRLGNREGAAAEFGLATEIINPVASTIPWGYGFGYFAGVGDLENAIPRVDRLIARDNGRWPNDYNELRFEPEFAALRKDPRVQAILARGAAWLAEMRRHATPDQTKAIE